MNHKLYVHYTNIKTPTYPINTSLYHFKYRMNLKKSAKLLTSAAQHCNFAPRKSFTSN